MNTARFTLLVFLIVTCGTAFAAEDTMLNLNSPSALEQGQAFFGIRHRFYGEVDEEPVDTFFGMDSGANVGLTLRYALRPGVEVKASRFKNQKEYTLGAAYARSLPHAEVQFDLEFFSYEKTGIDDRRQNLFYCLSVESESYRYFKGVINAAYDGYNEISGLGLGIRGDYDVEFGDVERIGLIVEYYPVIDEQDGATGTEDSFACGLTFQTYGHHFMLILGNSQSIGTRNSMLGTDTNDLHFGFNIHRFFGE